MDHSALSKSEGPRERSPRKLQRFIAYLIQNTVLICFILTHSSYEFSVMGKEVKWGRGYNCMGHPAHVKKWRYMGVYFPSPFISAPC